MSAGVVFKISCSQNEPMKHQALQPFLLLIYGVMCCIAGALGQATCGEDVRSSAGVACLRSNIAHNEAVT